MLTALIRTIILYFLIMAGLRLMGKRQIGELEPSELVLALLISDLAAVPMQDFGIPLINGVLPIPDTAVSVYDNFCTEPEKHPLPGPDLRQSHRYYSGRPRPAK